ncbi:YjgN family protein [Vibrio sp. TRT 21S02]|uniref:YjgN family protein n=1 Tax=Vibrio sp. TRT 21S02 TaxID=3418507 RepID=UPI003CE7A79B
MSQNPFVNPVSFNGRGSEFFGIWIVNILLSIITLGIYSAWAKVRTKRYFYGNTSIAGDNFEYHATPIQILKGRIVALIVVLIWSVVNGVAPVVSMVLLLAFYVALPWLLWSNARFDAAMTSYRNVRFSFTATVKEAYVTLLGRGLSALIVAMIYFFIVVTIASQSVIAAVVLGASSLILLAVLYGWVVAGVQKLFANSYQYGDWKLSAEITNGFFIKMYLKALLFGVVSSILLCIVMFGTVLNGIDFHALQGGDFSSLAGGGVFVFVYVSLITLSIVLSAYTTVCVRNYVFGQLCVNHDQNTENNYQLSSSLTIASYVWLVVSNFLLQIVSLGIARPWVMVRTTNYFAENTKVIGDLSLLTSIDQDSDVKSAITDEVAEAFDIGIGIG